MHPYEVYRSMADRIEKGWVRGDLARDGGVCLLGALNYTMYGNAVLSGEYNREWIERVQEINESIWRHKRTKNWHRIVHWNDAPWRRKATVVAHLRRLQARHADDYIIILEAKIAALQADQEALRASLQASEREVSRLRRLVRGPSKDDRKELSKLDAELDKVWKDLTEARSLT